MDFNTECTKGLFQQLFAENSVIVSSCETELTLPQLTGLVADSHMECMHHSLPIQRLFNTVCLEPAFLLKLFWLRNYTDESIAKLCALTGIFEVGLELFHSKMGSVRSYLFWRISLKPKVWFCSFLFYLFLYRFITTHACMHYYMQNNFNFLPLFLHCLCENYSIKCQQRWGDGDKEEP